MDLAAIVSGGSLTVAFTVANASTAGIVHISPELALTSGLVIAYARVSAANTVEVKFSNTSTGSIDPPSMAWLLSFNNDIRSKSKEPLNIQGLFFCF